MSKRLLVWSTLILASVMFVASVLLIRPADTYEMLIGFVAGTVGKLQWMVIASAVLLLLVSALFDRPSPSARKWARIAIGAALAAVAAISIIRDYRDFSRETVEITGANGMLQGTLYRPRGDANQLHPAVLLLHGSGRVRREAYHMFARRLAAHGFIVLNVDKRGVGGSKGNYPGDDLEKPVIQQRALDAMPALELLAARADVDTAHIGVFAISQGGWIVPLLLGGDCPARFAIVFSGVAVSSGEEGRWSDWTDEDNDHFGFKPPPVPLAELDVRLRREKPTGFNPRESLARMNAPSLWLFGEWDSSAPTAASMRVIDSLKARGVPIASHVIPEANHGLLVVRGPRGSRNADFPPTVWDTVFAWTDQQHITARVTNESR